MLARTVWAARQLVLYAGVDARIVVDTDDEATAAEALCHGAEVPFMREQEFAGADAMTIPTALRCLVRMDELGFRADSLVILQPTSPFRTRQHIETCWDRFESGALSLLSVRPAEVEIGAGLELDEEGRVWKLDVTVRGTPWSPSGCFYAFRRARLEETKAVVVPGETLGVPTVDRSALDVDHPWQMDLAKALATRDTVHSEPCRIIAEAGVNHNGDLDMALRLVDVAARAGADFVKFQTFDPKRLVSADARKADYQIANTGSDESQREMLEALTLPHEWHAILVDRCKEQGIGFMSTPFDEQSADFLVELGVGVIKIPSGEITNWPLLDHVAGTGIPIILSTGMSTLGEVMGAVERLRRGGASQLAVLHCVSNYPTAPEDSNLRAIDTLRSVLGVQSGWSDHTLGTHVAVAAVARGASIIEKHFTLDRELPGPDHAASLEPEELARLVSEIRAVEAALGNGIKLPRPSEERVAKIARKSLHATRDLDAGQLVEESDLEALRPGTGIRPSRREEIVGRTLRTSVAQGAMIEEGHLA